MGMLSAGWMGCICIIMWNGSRSKIGKDMLKATERRIEININQLETAGRLRKEKCQDQTLKIVS